jgi:hypothetical protein
MRKMWRSDVPTAEIAAEFQIGESVLLEFAGKRGWAKRRKNHSQNWGAPKPSEATS